MKARTQLALNGQFNKEMAALAGQKISKKLARRIKDYDLMISQPGFKAPEGTFHKPGSQK